MKIFKDTMKMHNQIFKDEHRHYMQIQVKRKQKKVLERIFPFLYFHFAEAFLSTLHLSSWFILKTFAIQEIILFRHNLLHLLRVSFLCHHKATKARNFFCCPDLFVTGILFAFQISADFFLLHELLLCSYSKAQLLAILLWALLQVMIEVFIGRCK